MEEKQQAAAKILKRAYKNQCFENGKKWYLNTKSADVNFTFGAIGHSIVRVPAHKLILATDSSVFEAMFYGDLKEPGDVHVPDSTEAAFMEFLQYFYLTEVELTAENVAGVLHLGDKYDVKKCVDDCVRFLMDTLDDENVCAYLDLSILYDKRQLIEVCEKRILLNTEAIFNSVGFLKCDKKAMAHILKMDVLSCGEDEVFKACMAWVKDKIGCNDLTIELVEQHLGELYSDIRFASMTMEQLCELQKQYNSVLTRDFPAIANIIVRPEPGLLKRNDKWNSDAIIECDRRIEFSNNTDELESDSGGDETGEYCSFFDEEVVTFSASGPLILGSLWCTKIFTCDSCDIYPCDYLSVEIEVTEFSELYNSNKKILLTMKVKLDPNGTHILLAHPILIKPGFFYAILFGPFPNHHGYYFKSPKDVVKLESDIKIQFYSSHHTSLISMLNFNKI